MERTLKVTGKGKISVKPDTIRIIITQTETKKKYDEAVRESALRKTEITEALESLGFDKKELKTLHFDVNTEYEGYEAKDHSWKQRLVGYRYTHRMKLEFPSDNERLGKVLTVLSACKGAPEFTIQYTIADPEAAKNELLAKAVEDSKAKAEVLSDAAGVKLGEIVTIDYSWGESEIVSPPMRAMALRECKASGAMDNGIAIDIEADDIDITDTVTVVWSLK